MAGRQVFKDVVILGLLSAKIVLKYFWGTRKDGPCETKKIMKNLKFTSLAVIIILFGTALIEAVQKQNWLEVTLFVALVGMALWADLRK